MENDNNNAMLTTKNLLMINHNCPNREKRLIERQVLLLSSYCSNLLVPDLDAELADSNSLELRSNQCIPQSHITLGSESGLSQWPLLREISFIPDLSKFIPMRTMQCCVLCWDAQSYLTFTLFVFLHHYNAFCVKADKLPSYQNFKIY